LWCGTGLDDACMSSEKKREVYAVQQSYKESPEAAVWGSRSPISREWNDTVARASQLCCW